MADFAGTTICADGVRRSTEDAEDISVDASAFRRRSVALSGTIVLVQADEPDEPDDENTLWVDISDLSEPLAKKYVTDEWVTLVTPDP